ncbi:MAG TPA: polyprenol phosphomannose-dependent alpha 1,6 mannosyltransferase MptB [Solirubrobacteraceae bacterium]|nr:polyprenol phosphomannose-dependent alpha 1,6 mannosyltransferase MptB [Solirubrobacteraceae bacterium]
MKVSEPLGATSLGGAFELTTSGPGSRKALSMRWGWVGLGGLLATGIVIVGSAARTGLLLPESVRSLPDWLTGPFGRHGFDLGLGGLIAVLALMLISYAVAIRAADQLSARAVLVSIGVLNALALLAPPLLSTDMFSYMAYGRMAAVYGSNPYLHGPNTILDPLTSFIGTQWATTPTAYGPLFTAISSVLAPLDVPAGVIAYKAIAAASVLVIVAAVWNAARLRGLNPVKAAALVGLNPVIVVFGVGGGHNDLLMLAFLVTGVYVLLRQNERTSGALIVAATVVKFTAGLLLPFAFAASHARGDGSRRRLSLLTGAAAAAVLAVILGFALFGSGPLHLLGTVQKIQDEGGAQSIPGVILKVLGLGSLSGPAGLVLDAGFLVCLVWLVRRVWKGELDWIAGAGWATFGLLVTAGLLVPWYVGWLVPLAALSGDRRLLVAAIAMTGLGLTTL